MNNKIKMLETAMNLRETISVIEDLLDGYDGIEGNKNYVKYCLNKTKEAHVDDESLNKMFEDTFNKDESKRRGINIATLLHIVEKEFKLLDDIDTAGDMFKPEWCNITKAVECLHKIRWIYCVIEDNTEKDNVMEINGECYKKEDRITLRLTSI